MAKASDHRAGVKKVLMEAVIVAVVATALGFAANSVSPRGLALTRNYFPVADSVSFRPPTITQSPSAVGGTNLSARSADESSAGKTSKKGLQLVDLNQMRQLFNSPRFQQELIVFIDARDDVNYSVGHIPGAYQFDPYHLEKYRATVVPICQAAEQVVVYCTGGDCEDSEFAAIALRDAGIANQKLFVFAGGITEWIDSQLPVEIDVRKSGRLRGEAK